MEFESLSVGDAIPGNVKVVITSPGEADLIGFHKVVAEEDEGLAADLAHAAMQIRDLGHKQIVIGVDPGKRPGIAAVEGNRVLFARELPEPEAVRDALEDVLKIYPGEYLLKCGSGGGVYRDRVLKTVQENFDVPVYIVDETGTTPMAGGGAGPNVIAAINIAFKEGKRLREKIRPEPTRGEKKTVQKRSRKLSGDITISEELAKKVAAGELSLEEAIEIHRGRK
jgi:hypothetical protein